MPTSTESVAGIIAGRDPLIYESGNPITIFLFQAIFIILFCQIIHIPLGWIRQPRVIAEVIAGIILGPSAMGHIPGFTNKCFPAASIPALNLVANLGVILFLFLVGLEVDLKFIKKNLRIALSVGLINMAIPFGFGCIISIGLFDNYVGSESNLKFTTYMVFIAVAMCITAFPVLARILTELRLLKDRVGTIVLAAGITNDIVGWMLLALSVTLANAGSGITTLYILLVVIGWVLFLLFPGKMFLEKIVLKKDLRSGSLSRFSIMVILLLVFFSSFFTDIIGVHPIFGAFLVGLIVPREHGFVVELSSKIEDLVHIILIPIYFALAGFKANLGELNTGKDWGYIFALIFIAVFTKIFGGFIPSIANGLFWRESLAVGVLMSCKGIVEIVVLTIGLNADIITSKVFSMFIVMMLVSTFLTTPLTLLIYPQSYRDEAAERRRNLADNELAKNQTVTSDATLILDNKFNNDKFKFNKVLYNVEDVSGFVTLLSFIELFYGSDKIHEKEDEVKPMFNAIFLKELSERTSDLITASTLEIDRTNIQLELLKKVFEFNEVPYVGDLKYYVGNEKLDVFLESSRNINDLMVYALRKDHFNISSLENLTLNAKSKSQVGILITNLQTKIDTLTIGLTNEDDDSQSLIIYLVKLFISNNPGLKQIKILLINDSTVESVSKYIKLITSKQYVSVEYIDSLEKVRGLYVTKYDSNTLSSVFESSKSLSFDIFAVV